MPRQTAGLVSCGTLANPKDQTPHFPIIPFKPINTCDKLSSKSNQTQLHLKFRRDCLKLLKIISWLTGVIFLLIAANHFFNPNFTGSMTLFFALSFLLFTSSGIYEYLDQRKKTAILYFFTSTVCFFALIVELVGAHQV